MISTFLFIDRMRLGIDLEPENYGVFIGQLKYLYDYQEEFINIEHARIERKWKKYQKGVILYEGKKPPYSGKIKKKKDQDQYRQPIAFVAVGSTKKSDRYFTFEIYPQAIKSDNKAFQALNKAIGLLCGEEYTYQSLYNTSRVNYLEVSKDIYTEAIENILLHDTRCETSRFWKGTQYLGSPKSSRYRMYDKNLQLSEVKGIETGWKQITRIESISKYLEIHPSQLVDLSNRFKHLEISIESELLTIKDANFQKWLAPIIDPANKLKFGKTWMDGGIGINSALRALDKDTQGTYRKHLRSAAPWWWKSPEHKEHKEQQAKLWESWDRALRAIDPQHLLQ